MHKNIIDSYKYYFENFSKNLNKEIKKIILDYQLNCHPRYKISNKLKYKILKEKFLFNSNIINIDLNIEFKNNNIKKLEDSLTASSLISLLPILKYIYEKNNINIKLFYNTLEDLFFRLNENHNKTGEIFLNIDEIIWLLKIFKCKIFKIGVLQFELVNIETNNKIVADILKNNNISYPNKVISIHIMENSNLTKSNIEKSFEKAKVFFKNYSNFYYCYSWLLFEPMIKELETDSNIYNFSKFFNIIQNIPDNEKAVERIKSNRKKTRLTKIMENNNEKLGISLAIKK